MTLKPESISPWLKNTRFHSSYRRFGWHNQKPGLLKQRRSLSFAASQEMTLKYYHTLSALDQETAQQQLDLITSPPEDNKYTTLKQRLTETFGLGKCERASRLLHYRQLGDSKPSVLMAEMLALLGDHPPVSFLNNYSSNVSRRKFGYNLSASKQRTCASWQKRLTLCGQARTWAWPSLHTLNTAPRNRSNLKPHSQIPTSSVSTIVPLAEQHGNANNHVPGRETTRPVVSGRSDWP